MSRCAAVLMCVAMVSVAESAESRLDYNRDVRPILADKCFHCHGPDEKERRADLRLDVRDSAVNSGAIVGGDASASELMNRITSDDADYRMPPPDSNRSLSQQEIDILRRWIEEGAEYRGHWAFEPIGRPQVPATQSAWVKNPIDAFVIAKLAEAGLEPTPEATREELLRRVTFDLTGLPPTIEELDEFLADTSPDAFEKTVERLLASSHYGERFAQEWLDVARYSDSFGYSADRERPHWYWRDWVIRAFNENLPYDKFVAWQLAGDMLPNPTRDQIVATGFCRNHPQNVEGGIVEEEFRTEYVADRVQTFGTAFLGMTIGCARCHDHKFDPVSQREFYELFSFFNNVDEAGQISWLEECVPAPTVLLPSDEQQQELARLQATVATAEASVNADRLAQIDKFDGWVASPERSASLASPPTDMLCHYPLNEVTRESIPNSVAGGPVGMLFDPIEQKVAVDPPVPVEGRHGPGLRLNGDDALWFPKVGRFGRGQPFTVGLWVWIPEDLKTGVIIHNMESSVLYRYRGYHVSVEDGKFDVRVAHDFPYNSIHLVSKTDVPKGQWIHVVLAYDGSSRAAGTALYVDGEAVACDVLRDNLYKDIFFADDVKPAAVTRLQVGARWRDKGLSNGLVDDIVVFDRRLSAIEIAALAERSDLISHFRDAAAPLSPEDDSTLMDFYLARCKSHGALVKELAAARTKLADFAETIPEAMVIVEMPTPRQAYLLRRGAYDAPTEAVSPGTPRTVLPFPDDLPKNRLGLAEWLFLPNNPLPARVAANRYWQMFFGRGLVATQEDFGTRGDLPTNSELLDWLASEFRDSGWNVKRLARLIVTSATYRQSSHAPRNSIDVDPQNRLLGRGATVRLSAEEIRDQALTVSGLLVRTIGGPSVKPYQPEGLWSINVEAPDYQQDQGDKLYRRSLYTMWRQTNPPPSMNLFDAPTRSYCVVRREQTATPLQVLVLINDPQFVEAARVMAEKYIKKFPDRPRDRWRGMYRAATSRTPRDAQIQVLDQLYTGQRSYFDADAKRVDEFLAVGESPVDREAPRAELAASAMVASAILSLDESNRKP